MPQNKNAQPSPVTYSWDARTNSVKFEIASHNATVSREDASAIAQIQSTHNLALVEFHLEKISRNSG